MLWRFNVGRSSKIPFAWLRGFKIALNSSGVNNSCLYCEMKAIESPVARTKPASTLSPMVRSARGLKELGFTILRMFDQALS
jgi:hypothetical protein